MTDVITVSGSHGYAGPLPIVRQVGRERGLSCTAITFDGDVREEYSEQRDVLRNALDEHDTSVVAGFSAGGYLVLELLQDRPDAFEQGTLVLAFDPPTALDTTQEHSHLPVLADGPCEVRLVYPSVRSTEDRIDGNCEIHEIPYDDFEYDSADPTDTQYGRMDRAHRFKDREDAVRRLVVERLQQSVAVQSAPGDGS